MKVFLKLCVCTAAIALLAFAGGCRSRNVGPENWYNSDNLYGEPLSGDVPLSDLSGLPAEGKRDLFPPVLFAYDSSQVVPEEAEKCETVAEHLMKGRSRGVIIEGHADERGSREYNLTLGERRALAVRSYLISLGVNPAIIQTKSYGEEMPADDTGHDESAWRKNRRAVFAVY